MSALDSWLDAFSPSFGANAAKKGPATEELMKHAARLLHESKRVVVFTGAGLSVESGIPDFRSSGGLWARFDPSVYGQYDTFLKRPELFWEMALEVKRVVEPAKPNAAHIVLAKLEQLGKVKAVVTQNIDSLHQGAGSKTVHELHGNCSTASCISCKKKYTREQLESMLAAAAGTPPSSSFSSCGSADSPRSVTASPSPSLSLSPVTSPLTVRCQQCDGLVKLDVILFGEDLPAAILQAAQAAVQDCDLLIVIGSSLSVSPANLLPGLAKRHGAHVLFINKEATAMEEIADVSLYGNAGSVTPKIVEYMLNLRAKK